jgi:glucose/arabinose dehydrogenase
LSRVFKLAFAVAGVLALAAATAIAAGGPPPPTATGGQTVTQVAAGLNTPTSFAFDGSTVFEGDGGNQSGKGGGVYLLNHGTGTLMAGSPVFVAGLAWHAGGLYVSGINTAHRSVIEKWSGWNGTKFSSKKTIYTAPKKLTGLNGIAFGPDGRLYVGSGVGPTGAKGVDHRPANAAPYLYDILSMKANGKGLKVFAKGIRQPWQIAFAPGSKAPFVSALGQDFGAKNPPDFLLKVHKGDKYGFPKCSWTAATKKLCQKKKYTKPFETFAPHTDLMGLAIIGKTLYTTSFLGNTGKAGLVYSTPLKGGKLTTFVKGFVAPVVGLGVHAGTLYIGELTGQVFSVKP